MHGACLGEGVSILFNVQGGDDSQESDSQRGWGQKGR